MGVLLGKAGGGFYPVVTYNTDDSPYKLRLVDLNKDGILDIAVAAGYGTQTYNKTYTGISNNSINILYGNSGGTFQPLQRVGSGGATNNLAAADFDGDGFMDIAYSLNFTNIISVSYGNSNQSFYGIQNYASAGAQTWVTMADFDNDGNLDIATTSNSNSTCSIFLGHGDGTVSDPATYSLADSWNVNHGDFNGDGNVDLVVSQYQYAGIWLLTNPGNAAFVSSYISYASGNKSIRENMAVGDVNNDGISDVIIAATNDKKFYILYGDSSGAFVKQDAWVYPSGITTCRQGAVVDVDNDGAMDIVFACQNLVVLHNDGKNNFSSMSSYSTGVQGGLAVVDVNLDGYADIAVTIENTPSAYLFLNNGSGSFSRSSLVSSPYNLNDSIYAIDVNKDGYVDLLASSRAKSVVLYLGNGSGSFSSPRLYPGPTAYTVAAGDLNHDGLMDVVAPSDDVGLSIYLNQGCAP